MENFFFWAVVPYQPCDRVKYWIVNYFRGDLRKGQNQATTQNGLWRWYRGNLIQEKLKPAPQNNDVEEPDDEFNESFYFSINEYRNFCSAWVVLKMVNLHVM